MKIDVSLYVIIDKTFLGNRNITDITRQIVGGGATIIQLRAKGARTEEIIKMGKEIMQVTDGEIPFIINDDIEAAICLGAGGVHVGQKDIKVAKARESIGMQRLLGVSVSTVKQAKKAQQEDADYIGAGPIFSTLSKADADPPIGLDGLRTIKKAVSIPVVAIGGITLENASEVAKIADGLAVISAILKAEDAQRATEQLLTIITKFKRNEGRMI